MTSGALVEDSASGQVKMRVMVKKPGVTMDNSELWRLYHMETQLLLVLVNREVKDRGNKGYLPRTQRSSIQCINC